MICVNCKFKMKTFQNRRAIRLMLSGCFFEAFACSNSRNSYNIFFEQTAKWWNFVGFEIFFDISLHYYSLFRTSSLSLMAYGCLALYHKYIIHINDSGGFFCEWKCTYFVFFHFYVIHYLLCICFISSSLFIQPNKLVYFIFFVFLLWIAKKLLFQFMFLSLSFIYLRSNFHTDFHIKGIIFDLFKIVVVCLNANKKYMDNKMCLTHFDCISKRVYNKYLFQIWTANTSVDGSIFFHTT